MNINEAIKRSQEITDYKRGGNKKCIIIGNYALLSGNINKDYTDRTIEIINEASDRGINVVKILDYKIDDSTTLHNFGSGGCYQKGWILQDKAKGEELYSSSIKRISIIRDESVVNDLTDYLSNIEDYVNRLSMIAEAPFEMIVKFVKDYDYLYSHYLNVDPSKTTNYFYDKDNGFSFIDLEYTGPREINKKFLPGEIVMVLKNYYIPRAYVNRNSCVFMNSEQLDVYNRSISLLQGKIKNAFESLSIEPDFYLYELARSIDDINNVTVYSSYEELLSIVNDKFVKVESSTLEETNDSLLKW